MKMLKATDISIIIATIMFVATLSAFTVFVCGLKATLIGVGVAAIAVLGVFTLATIIAVLTTKHNKRKGNTEE